jgi:hypothetical protein
MAFDAAPAVQAPMPGAGASAKPAARQGDASDPFGALLAMLDGAQTETAPAASPRPATDIPDDKADKAEATVVTDAGKDAPAADAEAPLDAAASDPAILVAAMMVPAAVTPPPVAVTPVAEAAAPVAAVAPSVDLDPPLVAADAAPIQAAAGDAVPADPTVQTTAAALPGQKADATQAAAAAPPADTEILVQAPAAQTEATVTPPAASAPQPAQPAQPRLAANDKPADPARTDASATDANLAAAPRAGAQGEQSDGGADHPPSDAEASQQAQIDRPAAPVADGASFAAAAPTAPEAPAPAVGVAQAAPPAPVIAAQAAVTPVRGAPETVAHLAAQMIQRLEGQTTRFDLTLNPQSLGRVDVRIEIGVKGALRARMAFDDAATAQEMSGRHTELRAALQNAGFDVPEGALSFDVASGGGGGAFAERQDADRSAAPVFQNFADTADQDPAAAVKNYFSAAGSSGVDIRV